MSDSFLFNVPKDQSALLNTATEAEQSLMRLESDLLSSGIKKGFSDRAHNALEHPALTALQIIGSAAAGAGIAAGSLMGGRWATAAKIATAGFAVLTLEDAGSRVKSTYDAMEDLAGNVNHFAENQNIVAKSLGAAFFDYPLNGITGLIGTAVFMAN